MPKLTNAQITFCQEYVNNGSNGTQAYLKAYKSCKKDETARASASRLLTNVNVLEYIRKLQEEMKKNAIMTATERIKWLTEVVKDIQKEEITIKTADGNEFVTGTKNADLATKLKAIDLINKMEGIYSTSIKGNLTLSYEDALKEVSGNDEY